MRKLLGGLVLVIAGCGSSHEGEDAPTDPDVIELDAPAAECPDCARLGLVCDDASGTCVECLDDTDCSAPETCYLPSHVCTAPCGCVSDADCGDGLFCNGTETCSSDCAETCTAGRSPCALGETCDEATDTCSAPECELPTVWYRDADDDGYGDANDAVRGCEAPAGYVGRFGDCDDLDVLQSPGAGEACDGTIDEDCDGGVDESCSCTGPATRSCGSPAGCPGVQRCMSAHWSTCSVAPPTIELCGGGDEDCDGTTDEASAGFYCGAGATCEAGACTPTRIRSIAAGFETSFAVLDDGRVLGWGASGATPTLVERAVPARDVRTGVRVTYGGTCALLEGGRLTSGLPTGVGVVRDAVDVVGFGSGLGVICFAQRSGEVRCWGLAGNGLLGPSITADQATSVPIPGITDAIDVVVMTTTACALRSEGDLRCWGTDGVGLLGNGTTGPSPTPVTVSLVDDATRIASSFSHVCVERPSGIWCWGRNDWGQLGDGTMVPMRSSPVPATVWPAGARMPRTMADGSTCVRTAAGTVLCAGEGSVGQLGDGRRESSSTPVEVTGLSDVVEVAGGNTHWCALTSGGEVYCWGTTSEGTLGDGTTMTSATPVRVTMLP